MLGTAAAVEAKHRLDSVARRAAAVDLLRDGTARFDRASIASALAAAVELAPIYGSSVHSPDALAASAAAIAAIEQEERRLSSLRAALCRCVGGSAA